MSRTTGPLPADMRRRNGAFEADDSRVATGVVGEDERIEPAAPLAGERARHGVLHRILDVDN